LLCWLESTNGEDEREREERKRIQTKVREVLGSRGRLEKVKEIAGSKTAGIWRIKRAKILLGTLQGRSVEELVLDVRVPPESVMGCQRGFAEKGSRYFEQPERKPSRREAVVERMLAFLEAPPPARSRLWESVRVRYIGHDFSAGQIQKIRDLIASNPGTCRNRISRELCSTYGLYQSNGDIKLGQMNDILKRMEMDNLVSLPPRRPENTRCLPYTPQKGSVEMPAESVSLDPPTVRRLQFIPVCAKEDLLLWGGLIEQYHYIARSRIFGAQMRYLVYGGQEVPGTLNVARRAPKNPPGRDWARRYLDVPRGEHLLGALGFGAGAWRLSSRDRFIGWSAQQREANLRFVVNNVRFLILPWIRSPNLASRILGAVAKQLPFDWEARYRYRPVLLETFVQLGRFSGTCYRAANWIEIGRTEGYSLFKKYKGSTPVKAVLVSPLCNDFRRILCRDR